MTTINKVSLHHTAEPYDEKTSADLFKALRYISLALSMKESSEMANLALLDSARETIQIAEPLADTAYLVQLRDTLSASMVEEYEKGIKTPRKFYAANLAISLMLMIGCLHNNSRNDAVYNLERILLHGRGLYDLLDPGFKEENSFSFDEWQQAIRANRITG